MLKRVYILKLVVESEDEISMQIDSVYTTREKAKSMGKMLVSNDENKYISYYISEHSIFQ
jgi:hypothetical protein